MCNLDMNLLWRSKRLLALNLSGGGGGDGEDPDAGAPAGAAAGEGGRDAVGAERHPGGHGRGGAERRRGRGTPPAPRSGWIGLRVVTRRDADAGVWAGLASRDLSLRFSP